MDEDDYHTRCTHCKIVKENYLFTPIGLKRKTCQKCNKENNKNHQVRSAKGPPSKEQFGFNGQIIQRKFKGDLRFLAKIK